MAEEPKTTCRKMNVAEKFVYRTLLSEQKSFADYKKLNSTSVPDHVTEAVTTDGSKNHRVWYSDDSNKTETTCVVIGSEYIWDNEDVTIIETWTTDKLDMEPFESMLIRANDRWIEQSKRVLHKIELTARHQREMIELDLMDNSDFSKRLLPLYEFLDHRIGRP